MLIFQVTQSVLDFGKILKNCDVISFCFKKTIHSSTNRNSSAFCSTRELYITSFTLSLSKLPHFFSRFVTNICCPSFCNIHVSITRDCGNIKSHKQCHLNWRPLKYPFIPTLNVPLYLFSSLTSNWSVDVCIKLESFYRVWTPIHCHATGFSQLESNYIRFVICDQKMTKLKVITLTSPQTPPPHVLLYFNRHTLSSLNMVAWSFSLRDVVAG